MTGSYGSHDVVKLEVVDNVVPRAPKCSSTRSAMLVRAWVDVFITPPAVSLRSCRRTPLRLAAMSSSSSRIFSAAARTAFPVW